MNPTNTAKETKGIFKKVLVDIAQEALSKL